MKPSGYVWFSVIGILGILSCSPTESEREVASASMLDFSVEELIELRGQYLLDHAPDSNAFPRSMEVAGTVRNVASKDWTSGFFAGNLLFLYDLTGAIKYLEKAEKWLVYLEEEKHNGGTHDMGFKINCSFGQAYKRKEMAAYKQVILESAQTLISRYSDTVGCLKSWDFGKSKWKFPVIIDNMMNLELLFEATRLSGDSIFYDIALSHATKTLHHHFRSDGSSYHVIDYDPDTGEVVQRLTHQGHSDGSAWARGQAWGLYGFTMAYRYTQEPAFLQKASQIATFIFSHQNLPEDYVSYWDFDAPDIPAAPRDASAAAVMASALIELSEYSGVEQHLKDAKNIINSLGKNYLISNDQKVPFFLNHSVGNMPKKDEVDVPIVYADYYFLEAIAKLTQYE